MVKSVLKYLLLSIFLTICFTNMIYGESAPQTITAEGLAGIRNNNKALARDQAIQDALRKAVEQAVGTMISSETMVENYQVLSDKIYAKTNGYIQKYSILSEKTEASLYWVTIQASVASAPLKNDLSALGLLLARKNMPRVMFMIAEQNIGVEQYSFWWNSKTSQSDLTVTENSLLKTFVNKGFHIVDHDTSRKQITLSKAYTIETLANNLIQKIGHLYNADIVIYGKALAKYAGTVQNSSMKSAQADISLRAVNTDTGQVIASASNYSAAVHPSEVTAGTKALRQTATSISDDLIQQIIAQWQKDVGGQGIVQLNITQIDSYANLMKFKQAIQNNIRGINGIFQREFTNGQATIDLETSGNAQNLADEISTLSFTQFTPKIVTVSHNSISLKLMTK